MPCFFFADDKRDCFELIQWPKTTEGKEKKGGEGGEEFSSPFPPPPKKHSHTMMLPAKERRSEKSLAHFCSGKYGHNGEKELLGNQNGNNI